MALAVSTVVASIGVGVAAFGAYENYEGTKGAAAANAAAAQAQAQIAKLQAANVDTQEAELDLQTKQSDLQIGTNKAVIQQQQAAADISQQQASLDSTRRIRQSVREGIVAGGKSLNTAVDSGAGEPGSTAVRQSRANISGQTNTNTTSIAQNFEAGTSIYNINKNITGLYLDAQTANQTYVDQSEVLQKKSLENQRQVYALGGQASQDYASAALYGGQAALGSGAMSLGIATANSSQSIGKLTQYFSSQLGTGFGGPYV